MNNADKVDSNQTYIIRKHAKYVPGWVEEMNYLDGMVVKGYILTEYIIEEYYINLGFTLSIKTKNNSNSKQYWYLKPEWIEPYYLQDNLEFIKSLK